MKTTATMMCGLILTMSACGGGGSVSTKTPAPNATGAPSSGGFTANPVQLTVDPCSLVTKAEAEALVGAVNTPATGTDGRTCVYVSSKNTGGQFAVTLQSPEFCKLLFLELNKNLFGGQQVRADVGDGGMQVKDNGNVQFVVRGGCVEVDGSVDRVTKIDDATILRVAKTAAGRVS